MTDSYIVKLADLPPKLDSLDLIRNKIVEGDCLDLMRRMPDKCVDAVITDPPYGVGVLYKSAGYNDKREDYWDWLRLAVSEIRRCGKIVVMTHRNHALQEIRGQDWVAVWHKPGAFGSRIGKSCVLPHWEPIFLWGIHSMGVVSEYVQDVFSFNPEPTRAANNLIGREKWAAGNFDGHPCPKPLDLWMRLMLSFNQATPGIIFDPFLGSGTTAIAAKKLGRHFIGCEISPEYCQIAEERLLRLDAQPGLFEPTQIHSQTDFPLDSTGKEN